MATASPLPPGCLHIAWRDAVHTPRHVAAAAKLLACGASRCPDRMTDLLLEGPHGALRIEPVEWSRRCWHAGVALPWPRACGSELWGRVLLAANSRLVRHAAMAFAVDGAHRPTLLGRVYAGDEQEREQQIGRQLGALLEVCAAVDGVARVAAGATLACDGLAAFIAPHDREDEGAEESIPPDLLLDLLLEAGVPAQQACYSAAAGRLSTGDAEVLVEPADRGRALLLSSPLGHTMLDGEALAVLRTNADLMRQLGLAVAHDAAGHRLVAHWSCRGRPEREFEEFLTVLDGLPAILHGARTVRDPADLDFGSPVLP